MKGIFIYNNELDSGSIMLTVTEMRRVYKIVLIIHGDLTIVIAQIVASNYTVLLVDLNLHLHLNLLGLMLLNHHVSYYTVNVDILEKAEKFVEILKLY